MLFLGGQLKHVASGLGGLSRCFRLSSDVIVSSGILLSDMDSSHVILNGFG